jgi:hypothetical protein
MANVWYRGEAKGGPSSKPGGNILDFGDGLYLTDSEDVAWQYAKKRSPGHKEYQVWQVKLNSSTLGRVLDLTSDARWTKFMNTPDPMLLNKSRLHYVRGQNELYNQFFNEFLKLHKIDLATYNAVIGPEYVHGGKQLCILWRNGAGLKLQHRIRKLLRPEAWAARLATVAGAVKAMSMSPEMLSHIKRASALVTTSAIAMIADYFYQKALQEFNDKIFRERVKGFDTEIKAYVDSSTRVVLDFLLDGPVFLQVTAEMAYIYNWQEDATNSGLGGYAGGILAQVKLDALGLGAKKYNGRPLLPKTWINQEFRGPTNETRIDYDLHTFSCELTLSKDVVETYRDVLKQANWYNEVVKSADILESDRHELRKERDAMWDVIDDTFGDVGNFNPTPSIWTTDGLARIRGA